MPDLEQLRESVEKFAAERDWDQFHTPKNLSMALAGEAGELLEVFQWLTAEQSQNLDAAGKERAAEEMADVLIYLVRLADKLGIDLVAAAQDKIRLNEERYPADKARGNARKYSELEE